MVGGMTAKTKKLELARKGSAVVLAVHCRDVYEAMLLYDQIAAGARVGGVDLRLDTEPSTLAEGSR